MLNDFSASELSLGCLLWACKSDCLHRNGWSTSNLGAQYTRWSYKSFQWWWLWKKLKWLKVKCLFVLLLNGSESAWCLTATCFPGISITINIINKIVIKLPNIYISTFRKILKVSEWGKKHICWFFYPWYGPWDVTLTSPKNASCFLRKINISCFRKFSIEICFLPFSNHYFRFVNLILVP